MRKLALAPLVALACCAALDAPRELDDAFRTPQSTVSSYWHRMVERRHESALDCFLGGGSAGDAASMLHLPDMVELRCRDFRLEWRGRGIVDVAYDVEYRVSFDDSLARFPTGDRLRFTRSGWKIERPLLLVAQRR
jgi:hypothetical protein